ncbi:MAG: hypothetical protein R8P61_08180 [Bacteroidia bacterium]|nr:hypothetical protein [Bacteroidia bacterium]
MKNLIDYKSRIISAITVILLWVFHTGTMHSQNCNSQLERAERLFQQGYPIQAAHILEPCIDRLNDENIVRGLRLLTIIYLLEDKSRADTSFQKLLDIDPEFRLDRYKGTDPPELIYLYDNFRTRPVLFVGATAGGGNSYFLSQQTYSVDNALLSNKEYNPENILYLGLQISKPLLHRNLRWGIGFFYSQANYSLEHSQKLLGDAEQRDVFKLEFTEKQRLLSIPVFLDYNFDTWSENNYDRKTWIPHLFVGVSGILVQSAEIFNISRSNQLGGIENGLENSDLNPQRSDWNSEIFLGFGLKRKIRRNYFAVDLRYGRWLQNSVTPNNRYGNQELVFRYGHVDDDFTFQSLSLMFSYERAIYSHKRIK